MITFCDASSFTCDKNLVSCGCGKISVGMNARIVNGENAISNSWPMIVSFRYTGAISWHLCGGTILDELHILTAAHCVDSVITGISMMNMTIAIGLHNLSQSNGIIRQINKIIIHPLWTSNPFYLLNDIAIVRLNQSLNLDRNSSLTGTCLPSRSNNSEETIQYPLNNTNLVIIGWGRLNTSGSSPNILQQVTVQLIGHRDRMCASTVVDPFSQLCADLYQGGKGACYGDSGGPIFQWIGDRWEQIGIVSYGEMGCATKGYPTVYTRISYFIDWIQSIIQSNNTYNQSISLRSQTEKSYYRCERNYFECGCSRRDVLLSSSSEMIQYENALPYSWSMIVSIRFRNQHLCSGTILDNYFILTTTFCLKSYIPESLTIHAGISYRTEIGGTIREVNKIYLHPNYQFNNHDNLAILQLKQSLNIENDIYLAKTCLPSSSSLKQFNRSSVVIIGWNIIAKRNFTQSDLFQQAEIFAKNGNDTDCSLSASQFCAGQFDKDICYGGDSGSPIFIWDNYHWIQMGLSSYCKTSNNLGVFTRLDMYLDWIWSIMESNEINRLNSYPCDRMGSCGCGKNYVGSSMSSNIGIETAIGKSWPMIVSIQVFNIHLCSGTILSDLYILTTASCADTINYYGNSTIVAGIHRLSTNTKITRNLHQIFLHPNFDMSDTNSMNDIAILRLDFPLPLNDQSLSIGKTCMSNQTNQDFDLNLPVFLIGWKYAAIYRTSTDILQQISVEIVNQKNHSCSNFYLCGGDIGGPILMYKNDHWEQIGIIPYKYDCASVGYPDTFIRLSAHIEWIKNITNSSLTTYSSSKHNDGICYYQQNRFIFTFISFFMFILSD
ncbi:hypothetical protein I4U23_004897 [Adineta vaga]|nr:hypothetical protein I4U23_004897 [Adineta vaga]